MLIVNADDLGLAAGVDRGILEAHAAGAVSSASMLPNLDDFEHAARLVREAPRLGVGLHFNIVLGRPLSAARTLVDPRTGAFRSLGALARRAFAGRIDPEDVHAECAMQLARLRDAGLVVTHIDSHRHAHCLPGVWSGVTRAAREARVGIVRVPLEPLAMNAVDLSATGKKLALAASLRAARRGDGRSRRVGFAGISLQGGTRFARRLERFLLAPPAGVTELMVHPGYDDPALASLDPYRAARETELATLTSDPVRELLRALGPVRFDAPGIAAHAEELQL